MTQGCLLAEVSTWVQWHGLHFSHWGCSSHVAEPVGSCGFLIFLVTHPLHSRPIAAPLPSPLLCLGCWLPLCFPSLCLSLDNDLGLFLQSPSSLRMRCLFWEALPSSVALQIGFCWLISRLSKSFRPQPWLQGTICLPRWLNESRAHKCSWYLKWSKSQWGQVNGLLHQRWWTITFIALQKNGYANRHFTHIAGPELLSLCWCICSGTGTCLPCFRRHRKRKIICLTQVHSESAVKC